MEIYKVELVKKVEEGLSSFPRHIVLKLAGWIDAVGRTGLSEVRKVSGYHDEPLKGDRKGQRSIRLSKHYRAIYIIFDDVAMLKVIEVSKHEY